MGPLGPFGITAPGTGPMARSKAASAWGRLSCPSGGKALVTLAQAVAGHHEGDGRRADQDRHRRPSGTRGRTGFFQVLRHGGGAYAGPPRAIGDTSCDTPVACAFGTPVLPAALLSEQLFASTRRLERVSTWQGSLLDLVGDEGPRPLGPIVKRSELGGGAWIDVAQHWVAGADPLFERLATAVAWESERRHMYDRIVDVPRLLRFYGEDEPFPDPVLDRCRDALNEWYAAETGGPLVTCGLAYYRDGADSVALHGDRIGRGSTEDTLVAILTFGAPRRILLRPRGGGPSIRLDPGAGDLLVMGGSCQRTWEHGVPKTTRPVGPRISVQFRPQGVR
jgi:alkylated DNA repair dioxygenase AlkB